MDQVWSWITSLPSSSDWPSTDSPLSHPIAASSDKSILLRAERTAESDTETGVTFSISLLGFHPFSKTLWVSEPFPLSSPSIHILFLLQLLQEVIALAPSHSILPSDVITPRLDVEPISAALDRSCESAPAFFTLALLCRLFWLCVCDAPADAGFLFFRALDPAALERALDCRAAMRGILTAVGADWEERFMRSLGYMLAKWCILRELQGGPTARLPAGFCPSYVADAHGLWILKGYAPVSAMTRVSGAASGRLAANDSVLRYALAHQQLEAVLQLEYTVCLRDPRFIRVSVRVDNIRLHVVRLGFGSREEEGETADVEGERHFPSRVRIWVGPEIGSAYAAGLSLGRSTGNPERELETTRTMKGSFGSSKLVPGVKAKARSSVRSKGRSWWWEQEAEGSAGVFEGVLCDGTTGAEVASGGGGGMMRRRYSGAGRAFSKGGGLVVAVDEMPEGMSWRVGREMEGRVLRWRIGGRVWVSYYPNEVKSGYFETRSVQWREEVDLYLVTGG